MAFGYTGDFYGPQDQFSKQLSAQSAASPGIGYEAARLADPFGNERKQYQNALSTLVKSPGEFSSSPFYQFAYDQGLNALQRKGTVRSGNKLAELMKYGQGMASQAYFPQANLLATLSGATTGSPAAAGLAVGGAFERGQNLANLASANKAAGSMGGMMGGASPIGNSWTNEISRMHLAQMNSPYTSTGYPVGGSSGYGAPSGGYAGGPSGGGYYTGSAMPYSDAGTGYISSDYGTYDFGSGMSGDSYYTPSYGGYDNYDYISDYSDPGYYSDYGYYDEYE